MIGPKHVARWKRRLSVADLTILAAVYALDFATLIGRSPGLLLVASWPFFIINQAAVLIFAPRGWDLRLMVLLVVSCLAVVLFGARGLNRRRPSARNRLAC